MSLIGTLEQFSLSNVLRRVEIHEKTGLLVVKQGEHWVEFYFRDGRLLCIGPLRTQATLAERLINDRLISPSALQEIQRTLADVKSSETRTALVLMDQGFIRRDELRTWAIQKAIDVLHVILSWSFGDVYFEEDTPPPADRLLVSMSATSIIDAAAQGSQSDQTLRLPPQSRSPQPLQSVQPTQSSSNASPIHQRVKLNAVQAPVNRIPTPHKTVGSVAPIVPSTPRPDVARVPTLMGFEQFFGDTASSMASLTNAWSPDVLPLTESLLPVFSQANTHIDLSSFQSEDDVNDISFASLLSPESPSSGAVLSIQAVRAMNPVPPKRIDTSFMQPEMLLMPADLSAFREQPPQVQVTPDQWRLLTCADGQTTLKMAYQMLAMPPEQLCQVAGELMAEHLLHVALPESPQMHEMSTSPYGRVNSGGLSNGYMAPAYAAVAAMSSSGSLAVPDAQLQFSAALPFETESQWGNGGNGATFVPGRGWITTPQSLQPLQPLQPIGSRF